MSRRSYNDRVEPQMKAIEKKIRTLKEPPTETVVAPRVPVIGAIKDPMPDEGWEDDDLPW